MKLLVRNTIFESDYFTERYFKHLGVGILSLQILKSLALYETVNARTVLISSKRFINQSSCLKEEFIWRGNGLKIKHSALIDDYETWILRGSHVTIDYFNYRKRFSFVESYSKCSVCSLSAEKKRRCYALL